MAGTTKKRSRPRPHAPEPPREAQRSLSDIATREVESERKPQLSGIDAPYTIMVLMLVAVGLICMYSASYADAYFNMKGDSTYYVRRQLYFALGGIAAMLFISRLNYRKFHYFAIPAMAAAIVTLSTVKLIPSLWIKRGVAARWMTIAGIQFQPSELAKFAVILCFASLITIFGTKKMRTLRYGTLPFLGILGVLCGLMYLQPHFSGMAIIAGIGIVMMYLGGSNFFYLGIGAAIAAAGGLYLVLAKGYASDRLQYWLDPFSDPLDKGFQAVQSLYAIGSGGLWGLGLGQSRQKHLFLPEPMNDFIFPVICEELGYIGAMLIIILFAAFVLRGYYIAARAGDKFGTLLAAGVTTQIAGQVIFNIGVVTGLLPVTGVSLPFFSSGGTSLMVLLAEVGVVLSVSRRIPAKQ